MKSLYIILLHLISISALAVNSQLDSTYRWHNQPLLLNYRELNTYNLVTHTTHEIAQMPDSNGWINEYEGFVTYDSNNNETEIISFQNWNGTGWTWGSRNSTVYIAPGLFTNYLWQSWNGSGWDSTDLYLDTYDGNNNMLTYEYRQWNVNAWANRFKYTDTYDSNNNLMTDMYQTGNGATWNNVDLAVYAYDSNNNKISLLLQDWDTSHWVNHDLHLFTYDANNNLLIDLLNYWNASTWDTSSRNVYTYNTNNKKLSATEQYWSSGTWINVQFQEFITYDSSSNIIVDSFVLWNGAGVNDSQFVYTYDANNNLLTSGYQQWVGSIWVNQTQTVYTYDSNNNMTSELQQSWYGNAWNNGNNQLWTYDSYNNMITEVYQTWDGTNFNTYDSTHFYYSYPTGINSINKENNLVIFPNPSSGIFRIKSDSQGETVCIVSNIQGKIVFQKKVFTQEFSLDLCGYPNGIYLVCIMNSNCNSTRQLIISRK